MTPDDHVHPALGLLPRSAFDPLRTFPCSRILPDDAPPATHMKSATRRACEAAEPAPTHCARMDARRFSGCRLHQRTGDSSLRLWHAHSGSGHRPTLNPSEYADDIPDDRRRRSAVPLLGHPTLQVEPRLTESLLSTQSRHRADSQACTP